jgi:hypothetical protein
MKVSPSTLNTLERHQRAFIRDVFAYFSHHLDDVPKTHLDIEGRHDAQNWYEAMESELNSLKKHCTFTRVDSLPPGRKAVSSRWVFKIKRHANGTIQKYKGRLVAPGFSQLEGIDHFDTYAPVVKHTSMRVLLTLAATEDPLWTQTSTTSVEHKD